MAVGRKPVSRRAMADAFGPCRGKAEGGAPRASNAPRRTPPPGAEANVAMKVEPLDDGRRQSARVRELVDGRAESSGDGMLPGHPVVVGCLSGGVH
jgi:hypothetical protein